jgi:phenol hydroxylase P2 protein
MPGMVKITTPKELRIRRESVEERIGREWETHEFQLNIISYVGNIVKWDDDEICIRWEH